MHVDKIVHIQKTTIHNIILYFYCLNTYILVYLKIYLWEENVINRLRNVKNRDVTI